MAAFGGALEHHNVVTVDGEDLALATSDERDCPAREFSGSVHGIDKFREQAAVDAISVGVRTVCREEIDNIGCGDVFPQISLPLALGSVSDAFGIFLWGFRESMDKVELHSATAGRSHQSYARIEEVFTSLVA